MLARALCCSLLSWIILAPASLSGEDCIPYDPASLRIENEGAACCEGDSPSCDCFLDGGAWDPAGAWIQQVALATLGTRESCVANGGKAYYQMQLLSRFVRNVSNRDRLSHDVIMHVMMVKCNFAPKHPIRRAPVVAHSRPVRRLRG